MIRAAKIAGVVVATLAAISGTAYLSAQRHRTPAMLGWNADQTRFSLPNGWRLTPVGRSIILPGDMPGNIILLPGGRALVNTSGYHDQSLNLVDLAAGSILSSVRYERSWVGMALHGDTVYVSGGKADDQQKATALHRASLADETLKASEGVRLVGSSPKEMFVSNLLPTADSLYVLNVQGDEVLKMDWAGNVAAHHKTAYRPYGLAISPDGATLAVTHWGDKSVGFYKAVNLDPIRTVAVQSHPNALAFAKDGRLFVANAGADTVSVIKGGDVVETIRTGIDRKGRIGATPVALAISPDQKTLFVADADNNCVAVVGIGNPGESVVKGFIPTYRYPTALAVTPDGRNLVIATSKGFYGPNAGEGVDTGPAPKKPSPGAPFKYIGLQLEGRLTVVPVPDDRQLAAWTREVTDNAPLGDKASVPPAEQHRLQISALSKIKHVVYVIKENRTYDQVLGDIEKGNGDPNLTLFGRKVTPNIHKLAESYTLFDNLFTDGEVSQCGHQWTDAAYSGDYTEKQWILEYGDHGEVTSDSRLTASPGEYIWTLARKKGLRARVYGEYVNVQEDHEPLQDPVIKKDPEKYGFSASYEKIFAAGGRDVEKVNDFLAEMHKAEKTGKWPQLMVMTLPEDHTKGFKAGQLSPSAMVGGNDLAVGTLIDAVSHSRFWKDTAVFIIEDDAQNGPDHVDSHRTEGLVVSPYIRKEFVDGTHYTTSSMLKTMEVILGLPPMTQYDAMATPMYGAFTTQPDFTPFDRLAPTTDLEERNPGGTALAAISAKLDWSDLDRADPETVNRMLWTAYRPGVPYPAPVRGR